MKEITTDGLRHDRPSVVHSIVAILAIAAIAAGLWRLAHATQDLVISHERVGAIPITVFKPARPAPAPIVVIAHGFAGSQQLMQPFAVTLARNGYISVTFDFPGHGRNSAPLAAGFAQGKAFTRALLESLDAVASFARRLPASDGRLALLGHSMGAETVVRYARGHPEVEATVGVSLFTRSVTAKRPDNLLIIYGALEPGLLIEQGYRIVDVVTDETVREGVTYGSFANGTARRLALAGGVEHIGVLYSNESMAEALAWMNATFDQRGGGFLDARGPWLGLVYLGLVALAWPLAQLLPRLTPERRGAGFRWRRLLPVAIAPALLTPLILWRLPTDLLPSLLGDYLALHFGLYGLLTAIGIRLMSRRAERASDELKGDPVARAPVAFTLAVTATAAYGLVALGLPTDWFVTSFVPGRERIVIVLAALGGTLLYFMADEWLTRGGGAARGAYGATKICFLISLALAIALDPSGLFFLVIIVPVILVFFVIYGLFSGWVYHRTNDPWVLRAHQRLGLRLGDRGDVPNGRPVTIGTCAAGEPSGENKPSFHAGGSRGRAARSGSWLLRDPLRSDSSSQTASPSTAPKMSRSSKIPIGTHAAASAL